MKQISILFLLLTALISLHSQGIPEEIVSSFEQGNAKSLSKYFNSNIELKLIDKEYVTSNSQAMRILQDFFKSYKPLSFSVEKPASNNDSKYGFGKLETKKESFKVNMYFLEGKKGRLIYYLSIEKE
jgi:hypothetical protein